MDKFGEDGVGLIGKSFDGEDWSINLSNIISNIKDRITAIEGFWKQTTDKIRKEEWLKKNHVSDIRNPTK